LTGHGAHQKALAGAFQYRRPCLNLASAPGPPFILVLGEIKN
jgi:hypothetical protein